MLFTNVVLNDSATSHVLVYSQPLTRINQPLPHQILQTMPFSLSRFSSPMDRLLTSTRVTDLRNVDSKSINVMRISGAQEYPHSFPKAIVSADV
jgi:hypothetical protein